MWLINSCLLAANFMGCWWSLQTVWTQIRPNRKPGLIWIQTVWPTDAIFDPVWTQIRLNRKPGLIWIHTVWHTDAIVDPVWTQIRPNRKPGLIRIQAVWHTDAIVNPVWTQIRPNRKPGLIWIQAVLHTDAIVNPVWTQIRPNRKPCLIWIQAICHSDAIVERIFEKGNVEKYLQTTRESWKITQHARSEFLCYLQETLTLDIDLNLNICTARSSVVRALLMWRRQQELCKWEVRILNVIFSTQVKLHVIGFTVDNLPLELGLEEVWNDKQWIPWFDSSYRSRLIWVFTVWPSKSVQLFFVKADI